MRGRLSVSVAALSLIGALTLSACGSSSSGAKRTVTVVNTITSAASASSASGASLIPSASVTVSVSGAGSASASASASPSPSPSPRPSPSPSPSVAPVVKVDPLKANCSSLLTSSDVKKAIGATIGTNVALVKYGTGDRGQTGALRCLFGAVGNATAPVRVRLTQYASAAAAAKQLQIDLQTTTASTSSVTVLGLPASLQIGDGGVVEMVYDSWTMALAVSNGVAPSDTLTSGLPGLAGVVLSRVIKNS